jgi:AbrB family looped-hinge helix DNA binding protein
MRTTIDSGGRVVVPKAMRDAMGLVAGSEVDISFVGGHLEIDVPSRDFEIAMRGSVPVLTSPDPMPQLDPDLVRQVLEDGRR